MDIPSTTALPEAFQPEPPATTWQGALKRLRQRLDALYDYKPILGLRFPPAERFVEWAQNAGLVYLDTTFNAVKDDFKKSLDGMFGPNISKALKMAELVLAEREGINPGPPKPPRGKVTYKKKVSPVIVDDSSNTINTISLPTSSTTHEDSSPSMATKPDETNENELDLENDEDGPEPEEEEEAPRRRTMPRAQQVFVAMPAQRRASVRGAVQPRSKLVPTSEKVRIHKRSASGARIYINDFTTSEIGNMDLQHFIKEFVDPEYGETSGTTKYEACPVDPTTDKEKGAPAYITVSSPNSAQQPPDSVSQIRDVVDLVNDLRASGTEEQRANQELMMEAKRKAMGNGDMSQLLMLMMMQNMNRPQNDIEGMVKVADKLYGRGGNDVAHGPSSFPSYMPMPLPPPPKNEMLEKMMELTLAKAMAPAPTFLEQMQQMQMIQQLMHPPNAMADVVNTLKAEIAGLRAAFTAQPQVAAAPGSIDAALSTFEKLSTVVKTLAPTLNAGGITGMLQSVFTPELMKTVGNMAASAMQSAGVGVAPGGSAPTNAPPQLAANQVAPTQPSNYLPTASVSQSPQPNPLSQPVVEAAASLRIAQTREVQLEATLNLIQVMYLGPFRAQFEPILQELMAGKVDPAKQMMTGILNEVRPDLNQPTFVEDALRLLFTKNGVPIPVSLGSSGEGKGANDASATSPKDTRPDAKVIPIVTPPPPPEEAYAAQIEAVEKAQREMQRETKVKKEKVDEKVESVNEAPSSTVQVTTFDADSEKITPSKQPTA